MDPMTRNLRLFKQFPQGIGTLFFVQIFSTLSYSVLYSTLVLYMTSTLGFSKFEANTITGFFLAFNYGLHLVGGFVGGRFLSNRLLFSIGMLLLLIACVLLSLSSLPLFYLGLAIFLTGSGLNVTCLNCMVTQRFSPTDPRRENAFFWIYSAMNIGFFTGFSASGVFEQSGNYHALFLLSGLGNLIALLLVILNWSLLKDTNTELAKLSTSKRRKRQFQGLTLVGLMLPVLLCLLQYASIANRFVLAAGCFMVMLLATLAYHQPDKAQRKRMFAFIMLMGASCVFFTLYQIAPMGLTLFIKHNVDSQLLGYAITPQWVQNVNTIVVVFGGPLLSLLYTKLRHKGYALNIPLQFSWALVCIGVGFLVLPMGIEHANAQGLTHINWIIASYILQSIGELLLSPVGYALVGQLAPVHLQGMMMGAWMMVTGVAAAIANYFSNWMVGSSVDSDPLITNSNFSYAFSGLGKAAIVTAVVLFLIGPTIRRLMGEKEDKSHSFEGAVELVN